ncbi:hypothetical protein ACJJTC_008378 [Scirpophaga incertulas]
MSTSRNSLNTSVESKRASKRRRVPNKFYGYSSDEESNTPTTAALKPQQPPKLEWRKEDLPSPVTHKTKREIPTTILTQRLLNLFRTDKVHLVCHIRFQRPAVRQAREGESVYCYCRCPYDEVSEMIACDAEGCPIEWFHFECVGIMVPPKGKWYLPRV